MENAFNHEAKDGENDGELGDDDAELGESVDDRPGVGEKGDFCEDDAEDEGGVAAVAHVVVLGEDVAGGAVADDEFEGDGERRVEAGTEDADGASAEEDGGEGLDAVPGFRGLGLDDGEPEHVDGGEEVVDGQDGSAGEEGEQDEREADDEVDEVAFDIEPKIVRADGEHAPFAEQDQDEADNPRAGDDGGEDGADAEQNVEQGVKDAGESVAAFANEDIVRCHMYYIIAEFIKSSLK